MNKVLKNVKKDCYMINANSDGRGWVLVKGLNASSDFLTKDLLCYFGMNDTGSKVVDWINNIELEKYGNVANQQDGKFGKCWKATNSGDYLQGTHSMVLPQTFTINLFINLTSAYYNWGTIVDFGEERLGGFGMWLEVANKEVSCRIDGSNMRFGYTLPVNTWVMLTMTFDSDKIAKLYVNGEFYSQVEHSKDTVIKNNNTINMFKRYKYTDAIYGSLDEVGLWSYAMTEEQVSFLMSFYNEQAESGNTMPLSPMYKTSTAHPFSTWTKTDSSNMTFDFLPNQVTIGGNSDKSGIYRFVNSDGNYKYVGEDTFFEFDSSLNKWSYNGLPSGENGFEEGLYGIMDGFSAEQHNETHPITVSSEWDELLYGIPNIAMYNYSQVDSNKDGVIMSSDVSDINKICVNPGKKVMIKVNYPNAGSQYISAICEHGEKYTKLLTGTISLLDEITNVVAVSSQSTSDPTKIEINCQVEAGRYFIEIDNTNGEVPIRLNSFIVSSNASSVQDWPAFEIVPHLYVTNATDEAYNGQYFKLTEEEINKIPSIEGGYNRSEIYKNENSMYIYKELEGSESFGAWYIGPESSLSYNPLMWTYRYRQDTTYLENVPSETVKWHDSYSGSYVDLLVTLVSGPIISITNPSAIVVNVGTQINVQLNASDNTGIRTIFTTNDELPSGLTLSKSGLLSGAPTNPCQIKKYNINVKSFSGADDKTISVLITIRQEGQPLYPVALSVHGAGSGYVNSTYDRAVVATQEHPSDGDRWEKYLNTTGIKDYANCVYCWMKNNVKQYRIYCDDSYDSGYYYYADMETGEEWPDNPFLVWKNNNGTNPVPQLSETSTRDILSQFTVKMKNSSSNVYYTSDIASFDYTIDSEPKDGMCFIGNIKTSDSYKNTYTIRVEKISNKYYWKMYYGVPGQSSTMSYVVYETVIGRDSLSSLGWPWDREDWCFSEEGYGMSATPFVPEFSYDNKEQYKGEYNGVISVWNSGSEYDGIYTCKNYNIDNEKCEKYARFEKEVNGEKYIIFKSYDYWRIQKESSSQSSGPEANTYINGTTQKDIYPWECSWSFNSKNILVIKGDGSNGGIKYGDSFTLTYDNIDYDFVYSNGEPVNIGPEPTINDKWKCGDIEMKWVESSWEVVIGNNTIRFENAENRFTPGIPKKFPWEVDTFELN